MTTTEHQPPASAAEQFAQRRQSPVQRIQHVLHSHPSVSPLLVLIISFVVFSFINPRLAYAGNISLILQQVAVVAALAIGQTLVILTAGIDLSVGALTILSMLLMANLAASQGVPGFLALLIGIAFGAAGGFLNGLLVTRLRLPPFIVTLGTLSIFTAVGLLYSGGKSVQGSDMPDLLNWTGNLISIGNFRITTGVLVVALLAIVMAFVLNQTAWGRHVYAVGDDIEGARLAGIRVNRVLLTVYLVAGVIFGITAWVLIGRAGTASPNAIVDANLESITAVVIGGTSLFGGRGAISGTMLGALIVYVFRSGLSLAGVDDQWRVLAIGVLIIGAVSIDQWIRKVKA
ncbi:fructose transport system permease protein [Nakamurella sp. UYEF19]|uniref:ABC transporter permease n=1 Tax=Nakamurella sp. UYEF19 TaxID=1756392 RepID=UPI00339948F0